MFPCLFRHFPLAGEGFDFPIEEQSGQARRTFLIKIKKLLSLTILLQGQECSFNKNSCGATRLDADIHILSCILSYAFFDNGVSSPARLLDLSTRPQKPIRLSSVIPQSHRLRLSVKHLLKLLALPHRSANTLPLRINNVNVFVDILQSKIIAHRKIFCYKKNS